MVQKIDLLIHSAEQICTMPAIEGKPQRGTALGTLGLITDGAVAIDDGQILEVGKTDDLKMRYQGFQEINAQGQAVIPGLVDPHTHLIWMGDRAIEFEMRLGGLTYLEIMAAGGGINSTVRQVRDATVNQMVAESSPRLARMIQHGTTTVEIKSGYGLNTATELSQLWAAESLKIYHPIDIVTTFLGAHAFPPEYQEKPDDYIDLVTKEMIPSVKNWALRMGVPLPFIDVFCEVGAFDVAQTRRILEAGKAAGMPLKIHADEFEGLGGTRLAVELGATSADHLVRTPPEDIDALGKSNTIAVSLPGTPFGLGHDHYTPARLMIEAGVALALATDCNPGTSWCESMQFIMALACRQMKLTPAEALAAATINAAFAIKMDYKVGSLEAGKQADVLILDAPDYRHLAYRFGGNVVGTVIKRGKVITN